MLHRTPQHRPPEVPAVLKVLEARIHCFETQATLETSKAHIVDGFVLVVLVKAQLRLWTRMGAYREHSLKEAERAVQVYSWTTCPSGLETEHGARSSRAKGTRGNKASSAVSRPARAPRPAAAPQPGTHHGDAAAQAAVGAVMTTGRPLPWGTQPRERPRRSPIGCGLDTSRAPAAPPALSPARHPVRMRADRRAAQVALPMSILIFLVLFFSVFLGDAFNLSLISVTAHG